MFRASPVNWPARFAAGLMLLILGGRLALSGPPPLRLLGLAIAGAGAWAMARGIAGALEAWMRRRDPYDLSRLWELDEPEEPVEPEGEQGLVYCHVCGAAMPGRLGACPQCGNRFRG